VAYPTLQLLVMFALLLPLVVGGLVMLLTAVPRLTALLEPDHLVLTGWVFYADVLIASSVVFFGAVLVGLVGVAVVPRLLVMAIKPDTVYRLYGFRYSVHRAIAGLTNRKFFTTLFGDSSAIVHYLRWIGYGMSRVEQTGSNFGMQLKHETPFLTSVGPGTMVADGLSFINVDYSSTSFRVSRASIGSHNFLGNHIAYPAQGKTGDNCLLATKVMVPIDGPVRENVGLLGSPPFEIPRSVQRDTRFDHLRGGDAFRRGLAAKNRHNAVTAGVFLLVRWLHFFGIALFYALAVDVYTELGAWAVALANVLVLVFTVGYFVLVERASTGFRQLRPLYCSIYDVAFWRHERFWKMSAGAYVQIFNGTPFKNVIWRLLGVRIGRRVLDDGCALAEKTLLTIGDDCMLNTGSQIQAHSQEDGTFKSDRITIGSGCTIGVGAWVHYGVTMGDHAVLAADSFLMKGEEMPPSAMWGGNPAKNMRGLSADLPDRRVGIADDRDAVLVRGE
jgi:non-ribosomal peptide synthetase-like protein